MTEPLCPRCGPHGEIEIISPHDIRCSLCSGHFVPRAYALKALQASGIDEAGLADAVNKHGSRLRPCPGCGEILQSFNVRREVMHECQRGLVIWIDQGALERLGGEQFAGPIPTARMEAGDSGIALAREPVARASAIRPEDILDAPGPFVPRPAPDLAPRESLPRSATPLTSGLPRSATPMPTSAPLARGAPVDGEPDPTPYKPAVRELKEGSEGTTIVGLALKLFVAAAVIGFLYFIVTTAFEKGVIVDVGGGYEAKFWKHPIEQSEVYFGTPKLGTGQRLTSQWGTSVLEAVYVPSGGGSPDVIGKNGTPETVITRTHGRYSRIIGEPSRDGDLWAMEGDFVDESDPFKTNKNVMGICRYFFNAKDGWLLCAYSDSNLFAGSAKARSFMQSFTRTPG